MVLEDRNMRLEIVRGARATGGEVLEMLATYRPGSRPPPRHYHPAQEERFIVKSGALWFEVDGAARVVGAGETLVVPPGAVHRARNHSASEPAVVTWETRPAMRTEELFTALFEVARTKSALARIAVLREFRRELVLASPPRLVQSCLFAVLAPLARAMGKAPIAP